MQLNSKGLVLTFAALIGLGFGTGIDVKTAEAQASCQYAGQAYSDGGTRGGQVCNDGRWETASAADLGALDELGGAGSSHNTSIGGSGNDPCNNPRIQCYTKSIGVDPGTGNLTWVIEILPDE